MPHISPCYDVASSVANTKETSDMLTNKMENFKIVFTPFIPHLLHTKFLSTVGSIKDVNNKNVCVNIKIVITKKFYILNLIFIIF